MLKEESSSQERPRRTRWPLTWRYWRPEGPVDPENLIGIDVGQLKSQIAIGTSMGPQSSFRSQGSSVSVLYAIGPLQINPETSRSEDRTVVKKFVNAARRSYR